MAKDKTAVNGNTDEVVIPDGSVGAMLKAKMSEAEAKQDDAPMVVCDFSEVSRRWGRAWSTLHKEVMQWTKVLNGEGKDDLSEAQIAQLESGRIEAAEKIEALADQRDELIAQVVVSVPDEWLSKQGRKWLDEHPGESIDWSDPDNLLDFIAEQYTSDLHKGVQLARARDSKN